MYYRFDTGKVFKLQKGDILYLPQGSSYCVEQTYAINFETDRELSGEPFVFHPTGAQSHPEYFRETEKAWNVSRPADAMQCMALLYGIIASMRRSGAQGDTPRISCS